MSRWTTMVAVLLLGGASWCRAADSSTAAVLGTPSKSTPAGAGATFVPPIADQRTAGGLPEISCWRIVITLFSFGLAFCIVVLVPYFYDQSNLKDFRKARTSGTLIIREDKDLQVNPDGTVTRRTAPQPLDSELRLIALDYVIQMNRANRLTSPKFFGFFGCALVISLLVRLFVFLHCGELWQGLASMLLFFLALVALQMVGLPHINTKFHMMVGVAFAVLLGLADFLHGLNLSLAPLVALSNPSEVSGYIAFLQCKHQYWALLFNLSAVAVLSVLATATFAKIWEVYVVVFGESYAQRPLKAVLFVSAVLILYAFLGVFVPIHAHLADIENHMCVHAQLSTESGNAK